MEAITPELADKYNLLAYNAGCPRDQVENHWRAEVFLQERQLVFSAAARQCDREDGPEEILFGGAMGGGKSHGVLAQVGIDDCQRVPGLKCLLLRKVGKANKENFEDFRQRLFMKLPHNYNRVEGVLTFANGSRIIAGHFQKESDIDAYLGLEYDVIAGEEGTSLTSSKVKHIRTRCRTSKPNWRPRLYWTSNAGGVGHVAFRTTFVEPYNLKRESRTRYVPSTVYDNAFVDSGYRAKLEALTGWERKAWLSGSWDIAAGQFFTTFDAALHVIEPVVPAPKHWRFWCSLDYGHTHYTTVYLLGETGDGDVHLMDEHGERGWLPQRHVPAIVAMLQRNGLGLHSLSTFVAGADVFSTRPDGGTVADTYKGLGITLNAANDDRVNGAAEILKRLGDQEAGIPPRLFIWNRCGRLIETLPALEHNPHKPEDVLKVNCDEDGLGGDDWYDGARYGVMEAARPVAPAAVAGGQRTMIQGFQVR